MAYTTIALINESGVPDPFVARLRDAIQRQVTEDFAPAWRVDATLKTYPAGAAVPAEEWRLTIRDDVPPEQAHIGTGWHDCDEAGPRGFVFVNAANQADPNIPDAWTVTASHEVLEMLVNPYGSFSAFDIWRAQDAYGATASGTYREMEICDPVADAADAYEIGGIRVSNFVYPIWFLGWLPKKYPAMAAGPFDHRRLLTEAGQLRGRDSQLRVNYWGSYVETP